MKKQNVNNTLVFNKAAVTELNENSLLNVNGGNIYPSISIITIINFSKNTLCHSDANLA